MSGFLGRNINFALFLLVLVVVLIGAGTTVLYYKGLSERTSQYETTSLNLTQCLTSLANYRNVLLTRESELNETSQDIRKYDLLYSQKQSELTDAQKDLDETKRQLTSTILQKEQYKSQMEQKATEVAQKTAQIVKLEAQVDALKTKVADLEDDLSACSG